MVGEGEEAVSGTGSPGDEGDNGDRGLAALGDFGGVGGATTFIEGVPERLAKGSSSRRKSGGGEFRGDVAADQVCDLPLL